MQGYPFFYTDLLIMKIWIFPLVGNMEYLKPLLLLENTVQILIKAWSQGRVGPGVQLFSALFVVSLGDST